MSGSLHTTSSPSLHPKVGVQTGLRRPNSPKSVRSGLVTNMLPVHPVKPLLASLEPGPKVNPRSQAASISKNGPPSTIPLPASSRMENRMSRYAEPRYARSGEPLSKEPFQSSMRNHPRVFGGIEALRRGSPSPGPRYSGDDLRDGRRPSYPGDPYLHVSPRPSRIPVHSATAPPAPSVSYSPSHSPDSSDHSPNRASGRKSPWLGLLDRSSSMINKAIPRAASPLFGGKPNGSIRGGFPTLARTRSQDGSKMLDDEKDDTLHRVLDIRPISPASSFSYSPSPRTSTEHFYETSSDEDSERISFTAPVAPRRLGIPSPIRQRSPSPSSSVGASHERPSKLPFPVLDLDLHVRPSSRQTRAYSDPDTPISPNVETPIVSPIRFNSFPSGGFLNSERKPDSVEDTSDGLRGARPTSSSSVPSILVDAPLHQNPFDEENDAWSFISSPVNSAQWSLTPPQNIDMASSAPKPPTPSALVQGDNSFLSTGSNSFPKLDPRVAAAAHLGMYKNERRQQGWSGEWSNANDIHDVIHKLRKLK